MRTLRIGIVGLGGIAQKAWLPVLTNTAGWTLQGAWSPSRDKALRICESWRIPYVDSLANLASGCDAVFVHSSTASHYAVVSELLNAGVHVCVDKPLAENLRDAERLVALAAQKKLTLMVGFNRRFAPLYRELKTASALRRHCVWINIVPIASGRTTYVLLCSMTICMSWIPHCGWRAARRALPAARCSPASPAKCAMRNIIFPPTNYHQYAPARRKSA